MHIARIYDIRNAYEVLVGMLEGNEPRQRGRHEWEDNIEIDIGFYLLTIGDSDSNELSGSIDGAGGRVSVSEKDWS